MKRKRAYKRQSISRSLRDIPDRMFVKLKYCKPVYWNVDPGLGLTNVQTMYSSLYDPEGSITGHQPYWYDQWTPSIFRRYRVYGIKYHLTVMNPTLNQTWYVGVQPQSDLVNETVLETLMERKNAIVKTGGSVGSSDQKVYIKGYMSVAKTLGLSRGEIRNEEYFAADYNANPIKMAALKIYLNHTYGNSVAFDGTLRCTYFAELFQKATPPSS